MCPTAQNAFRIHWIGLDLSIWVFLSYHFKFILFFITCYHLIYCFYCQNKHFGQQFPLWIVSLIYFFRIYLRFFSNWSVYRRIIIISYYFHFELFWYEFSFEKKMSLDFYNDSWNKSTPNWFLNRTRHICLRSSVKMFFEKTQIFKILLWLQKPHKMGECTYLNISSVMLLDVQVLVLPSTYIFIERIVTLKLKMNLNILHLKWTCIRAIISLIIISV